MKMATPGDVGKPDTSKNAILSNRLEDILQCTMGVGQRVVVTSATYPYHVEWTNSEWTKACGWQSDEILGLDCKFLQGDVTDQKKVTHFMSKLFSTGGYSDLKVLNYHKDNTLLQNSIRCFPIIDNCGPDFSSEVSHIAAILVQTKEFTLSEEDMGLMEDWHLKEVGMPIDRRDGCRIYPHCNSLAPPSALEWQVLSENLPLALMLRYMLRSQAPIVLTDREERIVHVNVSWVTLTGYSAVDCEGKVLSSLFHDTTEAKSLCLYNHLVDNCLKTNKEKVLYSDDNSKDFSAYSTDSESSDDSQTLVIPRTASIVLTPHSKAPVSSGGFQFNPWGASRGPVRPKLTLTVSPAAIKAKHMTFLFSQYIPKKTDKLDGDSFESLGPRKRSKSMTAQGLFGTGPMGAGDVEDSLPVARGLGPTLIVNIPFGSSSTGYASGTYAAASSSDDSRKKLLRCSSTTPRQADSPKVSESIVIPPPLELVASALNNISSLPSAHTSATIDTQPSNNTKQLNNIEK